MNKTLRNQTHWAMRVDLAAAFRWTARLNMHEAVANHFSLATNPSGTEFLINPNARHFARNCHNCRRFTLFVQHPLSKTMQRRSFFDIRLDEIRRPLTQSNCHAIRMFRPMTRQDPTA